MKDTHTNRYKMVLFDELDKIFQKKIKISKKDNVKTLEKKILKLENKYYPVILSKFLINL